MKKGLTIGLVALAAVVGMSSVSAQVTETGNQETNVSVTVSDVTAIDVRPSALSYDSVTPGAERTSSEGGYEQIEVENIGSSRVGEIYAQATMPTTQPFGTDSSTVDAPHDTGNFVTMSLSTAQSYDVASRGGLSDETTPHYLNRIEYAETNYPTYISVDDPGEDNFNSTSIDSSVSSVDVGRLRVGGAEYFYAFYDLSSGSALRIGGTPHTSTQLGTTDLSSDGSDFSTYTTSGAGLTSGEAGGSIVYGVTEHSLVSFDTTTDEFTGQRLVAEDGTTTTNTSDLSDVEERQYNLYYDSGDDAMLRTTFNVAPQSPGFNSSETNPAAGNWDVDASNTGSLEYILDATGQSGALQPGENFPIDFGIQIPQGVDQNAIQEGTVTLIASDQIN